MKIRCLFFFLLFSLPLSMAVAAGPANDELASGFLSPPDSAKPRTWWHWVSGNVSSEGITADLEAMKRIGLGGAQLFTVDQSDVKGPVVFLSPEWRKLVHQSLVEAAQLHLEISMEGCDGWSESGGHWVTPAQSMQQVVWTETNADGGRTIPLDLPPPQKKLDYYEDIGIYAFPTLAGDDIPAPSVVTVISPKGAVPQRGVPTGSAPIHLDYPEPGQPVRLEYQYAQPVTCSGLQLSTRNLPEKTAGELQASDDGVTYHAVCAIRSQGSVSFPPATAKYFRICFDHGSPKAGKVDFTEAKLTGFRFKDVKARTGMQVKMDIPFEEASLASADVIDPQALVDLTGKKEWAAPTGKWTLVRLGHTSTGATTHPSTSPGLECDKMSRDAVASHIEHLFTPVWQDSPEQTGSTFRYLLLDSWEAGCENWTPLLPEEFRRRRGYDLQPWLPALTGRVVRDLDATQRFLWDYRRTLADLVAENHYGVFQAQAHAHHMGLTSEAPGVARPTVADGLQCKGRCDIPMGEFWVGWANDSDFDDAREAASAAHIYGQNIAATESFTSIPERAAWTNDPYSLKREGDRAFCVGVNRFVFHRYAHQPWLDRVPGMSMGPWGINFERTNTWWEQGAAWISYLSRCEYLLQRGRFTADLCYFYGEDTPAYVRHSQLKPVVPRGYDEDVCNAEILLDQTSVEDGLIKLRSGMRYRVLVLPETDRMTLPMLRKIEALVSAGGVVYGPRPVRSPSLTDYPASDRSLSDLTEKLWGPCDGKTVTEHAYGKGKIAWGEPLEKVLGVGPDFASAAANLMYIHRQDGPAEIYFVSSQNAEAVTADCTFRVSGKQPELWHPDTGEREQVAFYQPGDGQTTLRLHFDPSGSVFVVFRQPSPARVPVVAVNRDGQDFYGTQIDPTASLPAVADNQIVLTTSQPGAYELTTGTGGTEKRDVPTLPAPQELAGPWKLRFPPKLGAPTEASLERLISWSDSPEEGIKYFSGTASYLRDFDLGQEHLAKDRHLYLDLGQVKNLAEVVLNGKSLGILWKPPFRVEITGAAQVGSNHLEIKVTNLWPNRLIGDQKLPEDRRITWASVSQYKADSPLLPSGLLGPVTLHSAQELRFDVR